MGQSLNDLTHGCNNHIGRVESTLSTQTRDTTRSIIRAYSIKTTIVYRLFQSWILEHARHSISTCVYGTSATNCIRNSQVQSDERGTRISSTRGGFVVTILARSSVIPPFVMICNKRPRPKKRTLLSGMALCCHLGRWHADLAPLSLFTLF